MSLLAPILGSVGASAGGALLGSIFGGDERDAQRKARQQNFANLARGTAAQQEGRAGLAAAGRIGTQLFEQAAGQVQLGTDLAIDEISGIGRQAKQTTLDREQQQLAGAQQSAISRGLGNTSVLDASRRGIQSDTDRALLSINESIAGLRSGLFQQQGLNIAQILTNQAGFGAQIAGQEAGAASNFANFLTGNQFAASPTGAGAAGAQLGGQLGGFLGQGIAGLFGQSTPGIAGGNIPINDILSQAFGGL